MKVISTTRLRQDISQIMDAVAHRNQMVGIGRRNTVEAVIIKWPGRYSDSLNDITNFNANSASFDFLKNEPDLYTLGELKETYA
jgi:hypothetical protein